MAGEGFDILIKFFADPGNAVKGTEQVTNSQNKLVNAVKTANTALETANNKFRDASKSTANYASGIETVLKIMGRINPMFKAAAFMLKEVGENVEKALAPIQIFSDKLSKTTGIVSSLVQVFGLSGHGLKEELESNLIAFNNLNSNVSGFNNTLKSTIPTVAHLAIALGGIFANSQVLKDSEEFNTNMRKINAIAQETEPQFQKTSQSVVDLATSLRLASPAELSEGMGDLVSSNFTLDQSFKILDKTVKGAKANFVDTKTMTEAASTVILSYGKDVRETGLIVDQLTKTLQIGKGTMDQLNSAIGTAIALAPGLNVKFSEVSAAMVVLSTRGETNATAATKYNQILQSAVKPTTDSIEAQLKLGVTWDANTIRSKGFTKAIEDLTIASKGHDNDLAKILGTTEALVGVQKLSIDNLKAYQSALKETENPIGTADKALEQYNKTWESSIKRFETVKKAISITFGNAVKEFITPFINAGSKILEWFQGLDSDTKKWIATAAVWGTALYTAAGIFKLLAFSIGGVNIALALTKLALGGVLANVKLLAGFFAPAAPLLLIAGVFWGVDEAVKASKESSNEYIKALGEILDKFNAIKLVKIGWDLWQDSNDKAKEEKQALEDRKTALSEASRLKGIENRTLEENTELQKHLITLSRFAHDENKRGLLDQATALDKLIVVQEKATKSGVTIVDDKASTAESKDLLQELLDAQFEATQSAYAIKVKKANDWKAEEEKKARLTIKNEEELKAALESIDTTANAKIKQATDDLNKENTAAYDKAIDEQKRKDKEYAGFREGIEDGVAKYTLSSLEYTLRGIEKKRKEALEKSRPEDKNKINLLFNKETQQAIDENRKSQTEKDKTDFFNKLKLREGYNKDAERLMSELEDEENKIFDDAIHTHQNKIIEKGKTDKAIQAANQAKILREWEDNQTLINDIADAQSQNFFDVANGMINIGNIAGTLGNIFKDVGGGIGEFFSKFSQMVQGAANTIGAFASGDIVGGSLQVLSMIVNEIDSAFKAAQQRIEFLKDSIIELNQLMRSEGGLTPDEKKQNAFDDKQKEYDALIKKAQEMGGFLMQIGEDSFRYFGASGEAITNYLTAIKKRYKDKLIEIDKETKKDMDESIKSMVDSVKKGTEEILKESEDLKEKQEKLNDESLKDWTKFIKDKTDALDKSRDKEIDAIKEVGKARRKDVDDARKAVEDTLKEIDKLYQDRVDDQKDKSGLNSIFQQRLGIARGNEDASLTRPNELDFNVGNGLTTGNETQRKKIQDDYELGVLSFDQMRSKMQEVALQKYLFYEEEVARVQDPEGKASADAKRIEAQKEFYQYAEDKDAKALNKKLEGQKKELSDKLSNLKTYESEEIASIGRINAEYQKVAADFARAMQEGINNITISGSINGADGKGIRTPVTPEQNKYADDLSQEAWNYGTVNGVPVMKNGQALSLDQVRALMSADGYSGGTSAPSSSTSTSTRSKTESYKSSTGYQDSMGHWFDASGKQLTFDGGGVTDRASIFGERRPEAAVTYPDFQNIYKWVLSTVSRPSMAFAGAGGGFNQTNYINIDGSPLNQNQLQSAVEGALNKVGRNQNNQINY